MSVFFEASGGLTGFGGRAPLFPLPNAVQFPNTLLPLHIFEPRYRRMTADALEGDRLIAMALLKPGWEAAEAAGERPAIHSGVCLGRITAEQRLPDGRYYLLLHGLTRARILGEEESDLPYRVGRLQLTHDILRDPPAIDRDFRGRELLDMFAQLAPHVELKEIRDAAGSPLASLSVLCDVLAAALRLIPEEAQEVFEELDVDRRSDLVLRHMRRRQRKPAGPPARDFPPKFSAN